MYLDSVGDIMNNEIKARGWFQSKPNAPGLVEVWFWS